MAVATDRVQQYQQDGVLFPVDLFSDDEIAGYRREFDRLGPDRGRPIARRSATASAISTWNSSGAWRRIRP